MKQILLFTLCLLQVVVTLAQGQEVRRSSYALALQYHQEFVLDGYIRVREWNWEGDKMN